MYLPFFQLFNLHTESRKRGYMYGTQSVLVNLIWLMVGLSTDYFSYRGRLVLLSKRVGPKMYPIQYYYLVSPLGETLPSGGSFPEWEASEQNEFRL